MLRPSLVLVNVNFIYKAHLKKTRSTKVLYKVKGIVMKTAIYHNTNDNDISDICSLD